MRAGPYVSQTIESVLKSLHGIGGCCSKFGKVFVLLVCGLGNFIGSPNFTPEVQSQRWNSDKSSAGGLVSILLRTSKSPESRFSPAFYHYKGNIPLWGESGQFDY